MFVRSFAIQVNLSVISTGYYSGRRGRVEVWALFFLFFLFVLFSVLRRCARASTSLSCGGLSAHKKQGWRTKYLSIVLSKTKKSMNIRGEFTFDNSPITRQSNPLNAAVNVMLIPSF